MNLQQSTLAIFAFVLVSCASIEENQKLNEAQSAYESAQMTSGILNTGAKEMDAAESAIKVAKRLQTDTGDKRLVDHYATVALLNTQIAQERYRQKQTQRQIDEANEKRQGLVISARSSEAESAKRELKSAQSEAMRLAAQVDELKAEQDERGIILTLEDIVFAYNSATLEPGGERVVQRIADYLQQYPKRNLLVEGFTDSTGSDAYNQELSERRAQAVQRSLINYGIDRNRISTQGLGEAYPVASNSTDAGKQQNRRVEVVVSNQDQQRVQTR